MEVRATQEGAPTDHRPGARCTSGPARSPSAGDGPAEVPRACGHTGRAGRAGVRQAGQEQGAPQGACEVKGGSGRHVRAGAWLAWLTHLPRPAAASWPRAGPRPVPSQPARGCFQLQGQAAAGVPRGRAGVGVGEAGMGCGAHRVSCSRRERAGPRCCWPAGQVGPGRTAAHQDWSVPAAAEDKANSSDPPHPCGDPGPQPSQVPGCARMRSTPFGHRPGTWAPLCTGLSLQRKLRPGMTEQVGQCQYGPCSACLRQPSFSWCIGGTWDWEETPVLTSRCKRGAPITRTFCFELL